MPIAAELLLFEEAWQRYMALFTHSLAPPLLPAAHNGLPTLRPPPTYPALPPTHRVQVVRCMDVYAGAGGLSYLDTRLTLPDGWTRCEVR